MKMKKKIVLGGAAAALVLVGTASAASLGQVNGTPLASAKFTVTGCTAATGGANVAFDTTITNSAGQVNKGEYVLSKMTVSNLGSDCNGKTMSAHLFKGENSMFSGLAGAVIENGTATFAIPANTIPVKDVTGGALLVK